MVWLLFLLVVTGQNSIDRSCFHKPDDSPVMLEFCRVHVQFELDDIQGHMLEFARAVIDHFIFVSW